MVHNERTDGSTERRGRGSVGAFGRCLIAAWNAKSPAPTERREVRTFNESITYLRLYSAVVSQSQRQLTAARSLQPTPSSHGARKQR